MAEDIGAEVRSAVDSARETWVKVYEKISAVAPTATHYEQIGSSLKEYNQGILACLELLHSLYRQQAKHKVDVAEFVSFPVSLIGNLNNFSQRLSQLDNWLTERNVQSVDNLNFVSNNGNRNVSDDLVNTKSQIEGALKTFAQLFPVLRVGQPGNLGKRAAALEELRSEAAKNVDTITKLGASTATIKEKAEHLFEQIQKTATAANDSRESIEQNLEKANQAQGQIESKLSKINEVLSNAGNVEQSVRSYENKFKDFDNKLDERLSLFDEFSRNVKTAQDKNEEREQSIDELIGKADSMIRGATVAGLSGKLAEASEDYAREKKQAKRFFYFAIIVLFATATPLALYVLPQSLLPDIKNESVWLGTLFSKEKHWLGLVARVIVILPAFWLATFTQSRYREAASLHRIYKFKETLAQSIDGFKREAPKYAEEITSAVFWDIREPPRIGKEEHDKVPNPMMHKLRELISKILSGESE